MALDDAAWVGQSVHEARYERDLEEAGESYLDDLFKPRRGRTSAPRTSPTNLTTQGHSPSRVTGAPRKRHEARSEASQTADESFNAPLAPTYADWLAQPNRYDFPLVDTVPPERALARADDYASRALEAGHVREVRETEDVPGGWGGTYQSGSRRIRLSKKHYTTTKNRNVPVSTSRGSLIAHEVGHAIDHAAGRADRERTGERGHAYISDRAAGDRQLPEAEEYVENLEAGAFDWRDEPDRREAGEDVRLDKETIGELWKLSERERGRGYSDYRREMKEVVADALAQRTVTPRSVRRDYPRAASWLDKVDALAFSDLEDDR